MLSLTGNNAHMEQKDIPGVFTAEASKGYMPSVGQDNTRTVNTPTAGTSDSRQYMSSCIAGNGASVTLKNDRANQYQLKDAKSVCENRQISRMNVPFQKSNETPSPLDRINTEHTYIKSDRINTEHTYMKSQRKILPRSKTPHTAAYTKVLSEKPTALVAPTVSKPERIIKKNQGETKNSTPNTAMNVGTGLLRVQADGGFKLLCSESSAFSSSAHRLISHQNQDGTVSMYMVGTDGPQKGKMYMVMPTDNDKGIVGAGWEKQPGKEGLAPKYDGPCQVTDISKSTVGDKSKTVYPTVLNPANEMLLQKEKNPHALSTTAVPSSVSTNSHTRVILSNASPKPPTTVTMSPIGKKVQLDVEDKTEPNATQVDSTIPRKSARPVMMFTNEAAAMLHGFTDSNVKLAINTTKPLNHATSLLTSTNETAVPKAIDALQLNAGKLGIPNQHPGIIQNSNQQMTSILSTASSTSSVDTVITSNAARNHGYVLKYTESGRVVYKHVSLENPKSGGNTDVLSSSKVTTPQASNVNLTAEAPHKVPMIQNIKRELGETTSDTAFNTNDVRSLCRTPQTLMNQTPSNVQTAGQTQSLVSIVNNTPIYRVNSNSFTSNSSSPVVNTVSTIGSNLPTSSIKDESLQKPSMVINYAQAVKNELSPNIMNIPSIASTGQPKIQYVSREGGPVTFRLSDGRSVVLRRAIPPISRSSKLKQDSKSLVQELDTKSSCATPKDTPSNESSSNNSVNELPIVIDSVFSLSSEPSVESDRRSPKTIVKGKNKCKKVQSKTKSPEPKGIKIQKHPTIKAVDDMVEKEFDHLANFQGIILPDDAITDSKVFSPCYVVLETMTMRNMKLCGISDKCTKRCRENFLKKRSKVRLSIEKHNSPEYMVHDNETETPDGESSSKRFPEMNIDNNIVSTESTMVRTSTEATGNTMVKTSTEATGNIMVKTSSEATGNTMVKTSTEATGNTMVKTSSEATGNTMVKTSTEATGNTMVKTSTEATGNTMVRTSTEATGNTMVRTPAVTTGISTVSTGNIMANTSSVSTGSMMAKQTFKTTTAACDQKTASQILAELKPKPTEDISNNVVQPLQNITSFNSFQPNKQHVDTLHTQPVINTGKLMTNQLAAHPSMSGKQAPLSAINLGSLRPNSVGPQKFFLVRIENKSVLIPVNTANNPKAFVIDSKMEKDLGIMPSTQPFQTKNLPSGGLRIGASQNPITTTIAPPISRSLFDKTLVEKQPPVTKPCTSTVTKASESSNVTPVRIKSEPVTSGYGDEKPDFVPIKIKKEPMNKGYPDEPPIKENKESKKRLSDTVIKQPPAKIPCDDTNKTKIASKEERIKSLKDRLRQQEQELEALRKKMASQPAVDMDF